MKIHHIGYLVKKLDRAISAFQALGWSFNLDSKLFHDEDRRIDIVFLNKDEYVIELVSPYDPNSVVHELLRRIGNCPYHICYETDNLDEEVARLRNERYVPCFGEGRPAEAFGGRRVVHLIHPYIGMLELLETKKQTM